jgi:Icc-related predicted phosphoesterase
MRVVVVSDLHGDLDSARRAVDRFGPELILSCGDWGDPEEVDEARFAAMLAVAPIYTTFGNHDPMDLLHRFRNADDSPVLLPQGEVRDVLGLNIAAIGGIWAKSHKKPYYVTDEDVADFAARISRSGPVDILLTHGCPVGLADLTPSGRHGGQRCFLDANKAIAPRLHLCGHLHVPQDRTLKDGRRIINVGATPEGSVVVIESDPARGGLDSRLERCKTA